MIKYIYDKHKAQGDNLSFRDLVELVTTQLEGAFALLFKSIHFPGEVAATRRGSPLLVGVKCESELATNHIPVVYSKGKLQLIEYHFPINFVIKKEQKKKTVEHIQSKAYTIYRAQKYLNQEYSHNFNYFSFFSIFFY